MIKLKKIVAVALATAMCMGLSVTAFAEDRGDAEAILQGWELDSPYYATTVNDGSTTPGTDVAIDATNAAGEQNDKLTVTGTGIPYDSKAYNSINTQAEVLNVLKQNGYGVEKNAKIIPIADGVINGVDDEGTNVLAFTLPAGEFTTDAYDDHSDKYHPGDKVYGMFETGENTGVWEMREGTVSAEGKVNFPVEHKGAFVIIKSMKNGKVVALTKDSNGNIVDPPTVVPNPEDPTKPVDPSKPADGTSTNKADGQNQASTTKTNTLGTSPKTGEF